MVKWGKDELLPLWPRPRRVPSSGASAAVVTKHDDLIVHSGGCCQDLLADAIARYMQIIFWVPEGGALPYLRIRAPGGLRDDARPPALCEAGESPPSFAQLAVVVESDAETPLQLGVDESYTLRLYAAGGGPDVITAERWPLAASGGNGCMGGIPAGAWN